MNKFSKSGYEEIENGASPVLDKKAQALNTYKVHGYSWILLALGAGLSFGLGPVILG